MFPDPVDDIESTTYDGRGRSHRSAPLDSGHRRALLQVGSRFSSLDGSRTRPIRNEENGEKESGEGWRELDLH